MYLKNLQLFINKTYVSFIYLDSAYNFTLLQISNSRFYHTVLTNIVHVINQNVVRKP